MKQAHRLITALSFLTVLPMPDLTGKIKVEDIGKSSAYFPVGGFLIGMLLFFCGLLFITLFPMSIAAGLLLVMKALLTGAFHYDGLSDTMDAIGSRKSVEAKREIMKGSSAGPMGVVALIFVILIQHQCLSVLLRFSPKTAIVLLLLVVVYSRYGALCLLYTGQRASPKEGLGKLFMEQTKLPELLTGTFWIILITFLAIFMRPVILFEIPSVVLLFPLTWIFILILRSIFNLNFAGLTGDNAGAAIEINETLYLLVFVAFMMRL